MIWVEETTAVTKQLLKNLIVCSWAAFKWQSLIKEKVLKNKGNPNNKSVIRTLGFPFYLGNYQTNFYQYLN